MKLSIIIAVYNSHEAFSRQIKYFTAMNLPDDIEFIIVDDGSDPPLKTEMRNLKIHYTNDKRPWTQGLARNAGAKLAKGEYLFFTDIDHILSKEAIMDAYSLTEDKMIFPRYLAILLEDGALTQNSSVLIDYGMDPDRLTSKKGLWASYHGNTYTIKKSTFEEIGGYDIRHCSYGHHAARRCGEDSAFNRRWNHLAAKRDWKCVTGSQIYIFPTGRFNINNDLNPKGLFHNLSYAEVMQPMKGKE